jgi:DNA-binding LytR/AlgR family response regulator
MIDYSERRVTFYLRDKAYYQITYLKELRPLGFHAFGRDSLVNLNNISHFDANTGHFVFRSGAAVKIAAKYYSNQFLPTLETLVRNYQPVYIPWKMTVWDGEEIRCINLMDVDYIGLQGRNIIYVCGPQTLFQIQNLSDLETSKEIYESGLWSLDRQNYVNVNKISFYDPREGLAYFAPGEKAAGVARIHKQALKAKLRSIERGDAL